MAATTLTIDLRAHDVGTTATSVEAVVGSIIDHTERSWSEGSDLVVFPEYVWMLLEQLVEGKDKVSGVARLFWETVWPELEAKLCRSNKAVVLGTVPCLMPDGSLRNRSPILCDGAVVFQDKLCLTPWESAFEGGDAIQLWRLKGATFAVLVCFDIEIPELAVALRGRGVDAVLVPSATETILGLERISRCASARSVELCCHVGVAHLTGTSRSVLVDKNVGRAAWYSPSQAAFHAQEKMLATRTVWAGGERQLGQLDLKRLAKSRASRMETNPALLPSGIAQKILVEPPRFL